MDITYSKCVCETTHITYNKCVNEKVDKNAFNTFVNKGWPVLIASGIK